LRVWVTEREKEKKELLATNGYKLIHAEPVTIFSYSKEFPEIKLPGGFVKMSLAEENDLAKIHACLWQGFDHNCQHHYCRRRYGINSPFCPVA